MWVEFGNFIKPLHLNKLMWISKANRYYIEITHNHAYSKIKIHQPMFGRKKHHTKVDCC
jgi:hypothetical protein